MSVNTRERVWAEIDLDNLICNFNTAKELVGNGEVMCVIKADAYGHGAPQAAKALAGAGAKFFAAATAEEAIQLRRHGITQPVLLLGMAEAASIPQLAEMDISATVVDIAAARAFSEKLGSKKLRIHIKIETGMNRTGLRPDKAVEQTLNIASLPGLIVEGIFTHLPAADDDIEFDFTDTKISTLCNVVSELRKKGLNIPMTHYANSAASICSAKYTDDDAFNYYRPGIMLYGSNPCFDTTTHPADIKPVMSLRARVAQVKQVAKGESVSYGRTWFAKRDSVIATVGVGYADGLFRSLSGKAHMLVRGKRAPQVGRICMDMCMLDVTDIPGVSEGDTATIIGSDGAERIIAEELAAAANTIPYEIFCAVGRRVRRVYIQHGEQVESICYIDRL